MKLYQFPPNYSENDCALLSVPTAFIPFMRRWFDLLQQRYVWATESDYQQGYQVVARMEAFLMNGCLQQLIESNRQIYRLLDTSLNGATYTATGTDPVTNLPLIDPAIPAVPDVTSPAQLPGVALRRRLERLIDLVDNGFNGTLIPDQPTAQPSARDNLEAIRVLLAQNGTDNEDLEELINLVLLALA